jgi:hypothetical protein
MYTAKTKDPFGIVNTLPIELVSDIIAKLAADPDPMHLTRFGESNRSARELTEKDRVRLRDEFERSVRDAIIRIQMYPASSWAGNALNNFKWLYRQASRMQNENYKEDALRRLEGCVPGQMFYEFVKYDVTLRQASEEVRTTGKYTGERDVEKDFYGMVKSLAQLAGVDTQDYLWRRDFFDIGGLVTYPVANTILDEMRERMEDCKNEIAESQRQGLVAERVAGLRENRPSEAGPSNSKQNYSEVSSRRDAIASSPAVPQQVVYPPRAPNAATPAAQQLAALQAGSQSKCCGCRIG